MDWILVILITVSGFIKVINVEKIPGFHSKAACAAAITQIKEAYTKEATFLCIPTYKLGED